MTTHLRTAGFPVGVPGLSRKTRQATSRSCTADTPVEDWIDNGDRTYRVTTYGSSGPGGGLVGNYLVIDALDVRRTVEWLRT